MIAKDLIDGCIVEDHGAAERELTSAFLDGATLYISGFINIAQDNNLRIEFFANTSGDEGENYLGFQNVDMDSTNKFYSQRS